MEAYRYLLDLGIILLITKAFSILTKRIDLPQVVGALAAGLILGPAVLNLVSPSGLMSQLSELGVVMLMFTAGLETDIKELKTTGVSGIVIALLGVIVPFACGFGLAALFTGEDGNMLQNAFIGTVLTATSVSITVETLKEMGKLSTRSGTAILAAALIDDILGLILLTFITSLAGNGVSVIIVLGKIAAFFVLALILGKVIHILMDKWMSASGFDRRRFAVISVSFCLLCAFAAELFGIADIIGAFIAGLIISNTTRVTYVASKCETVSYMLLSPIFFANVGLSVTLGSMDMRMVLFTVILVVLSVLSKVVGCGLGAKLCRYSNSDALKIGCGMVTRGEVALIVAAKGAAAELFDEAFLAPVVILIIVTSIITPIMLRAVYKGSDRHADLMESQLAENYQDIKDYDLAAQAVLDMHYELKNPDERKK